MYIFLIFSNFTRSDNVVRIIICVAVIAMGDARMAHILEINRA
jgi:hypothetical protein